MAFLVVRGYPWYHDTIPTGTYMYLPVRKRDAVTHGRSFGNKCRWLWVWPACGHVVVSWITPCTVKSFLCAVCVIQCIRITSQISSLPSHFRRQRSQPLRWICWNFCTTTECAFAIEHHQWIRVFPWLYWCRSVWSRRNHFFRFRFFRDFFN
jgi:hypothetical protein